VRRTRLAALGVVVVAAGAVGGALVLGSSHGPRRAPPRASRPSTAVGRDLPTTTALSSVLTPTTPTAFSAAYAAPASPYTVVIDASAQCWVMATSSSTGKVVWTGTVAGGGSQSIPATGDLTVELGAPTEVTVMMDGRPVQLPTGYRSPFDLNFRVAA